MHAAAPPLRVLDLRFSGRHRGTSAVIPAHVSEVIGVSLTNPSGTRLTIPSGRLDRLQAYLHEGKGIPIKRTRIDELLLTDGLGRRQQETWFGERVDPAFAEKRGHHDALYHAAAVPPEPQPTATVATTDQEAMTGAAPHKPARPVGRATQARRLMMGVGHGRSHRRRQAGRWRSLDRPYVGRTTANWVNFLAQVEAWLPPTIERVYAIMDHLSAHRAIDVLLCSRAHPRWEFVFHPKYTPYLNLIEPWRKVLRSLALKGWRFATWLDVCQAVQEATASWNPHHHPFIWGRRRRHHARHRLGIGLLPIVA